MHYPLWKKIVGGLCIVLGLLAFVTPLTPGSWLIFVGAEMLGIGILSRGNIIRLYKKLKTKLTGLAHSEKESDLALKESEIIGDIRPPFKPSKESEPS